MEYKVLASFRDELNQGWVWANQINLEPRSIVKIINLKNKKVIYCECLEIDNNYVSAYNHKPRAHINENEKTITMNQWYRKRLGGIKTKHTYDLEIWEANGWYGSFRANIGHPQIIVRMATWLAIISVCLGVLSICMGAVKT